MDEKDAEFSRAMSSLPYSYAADSRAREIRVGYPGFEGKSVSVAGRAIAVRKSGKLVFVDLLDSSGKIQCYFDYNALGEESFKMVKSLNVGDIFGAAGKVFKTKPGEISINVSSVELLARAKTPLPPKWYGSRTLRRGTGRGTWT